MIDPLTVTISAGRSSWLCSGTMPPGWTTSRRVRSWRPSTLISGPEVDRADSRVGDVLGHGRGIGERIGARGLALAGQAGRGAAERGDGNDAGRERRSW